MLPAMIFASDGDALARIQRRCAGASFIKLFQAATERPGANDMIRLIRSYHPELVFIEFHDRDDALRTEAVLRAALPKLAIIGFASHWQYERCLRTERGDLRIILSAVTLDEFQETILAAMRAVQEELPDNLIVFLPSKAGGGASTVALNVAGALANNCGKSAILIEADLHSGPAGMYLKVNPQHSVVDALQESGWLESYWDELMPPGNRLAVLPASNIKGGIPQPSPWEYRRLISLVKQRYDHVFFDLPEVINQATEAIVQDARTVYIVCTPEVPSLILARRRCSNLLSNGVPDDRLKVVLNRCVKGGPDLAALEEIIGRGIEETLPNDYQAVWSANLKQLLVDPKTALGRSFHAFARKLSGGDHSKQSQRRFFGLFGSAA